MGTYIQVGVCTDVTIYRAVLAKLNLTAEQAVRRMPTEFGDMSGFTAYEDADELRWTLPKVLIEDGLVPFLRAQYALFGHRAPKDRTRVARLCRQQPLVQPLPLATIDRYSF